MDTGELRALVHVGAGKLRRSTGRLLQSIGEAGIEPVEADMVLITHAHPDHVGGILVLPLLCCRMHRR